MDTPSIREKPMTLNPFDWTAGPFLALYVTLALIIFVQAFRAKRSIGPPANGIRKLKVLELAYLAGGARRLGDVILLTLTAGRGASISDKADRITVTDTAPLAAMLGRPVALSFERDMTRKQFQAAVEPMAARVRERLEQLGYCPTSEQVTSFRMNFLPFVGLLIAFGATKAYIGAGRNHPVEFLVFLLFATAFVALIVAARPVRTRAGNEALEDHQATNARAARAPLDHELPLAVALSGAVVLSGTSHSSVYAASQTMSNTGGGSSCGGGGCGGGGGGGCGGCS